MERSIFDDDRPRGEGRDEPSRAEAREERREERDFGALERGVERVEADVARVERDEAPEERQEHRGHDERGEGRGSSGGDYPDAFGYGRRRRDRDLEQLDRLHCRVVGDQKRYEYVNLPEVETAMRTREEQFGTAQSGYLTARHTAAPQVVALRTEIGKVIEQLRCMIGGDQERLDQAWQEVHRRLHKCMGSPDPCLSDEDCHFATDPDDVSTAVLRARQQEYTERVTRAETRFDALIGEADALATRVTNLQAEAAALVTDTESTTADHRLTYAKALVADFHAGDGQIWGGFPIANLYDDCLRKCLRCSIRGRRALTGIIGELAVRDCWRQKQQARCDWLATHLAEEIFTEAEELAERERRRARV